MSFLTLGDEINKKRQKCNRYFQTTKVVKIIIRDIPTEKYLKPYIKEKGNKKDYYRKIKIRHLIILNLVEED